jgi:hypothetical protein
MFPDALNVCHQIPGRIFPQFCLRDTFACPSLVEQHNTPSRRIKKLSINGRTAPPWSPMDKNNGLPLGIPRFLVIEGMDLGNA